MDTYTKRGEEMLKDIPDFTGYKADEYGNIYSMIPQGCRNRFDKTKWSVTPKKLNYRVLLNGYCRVYMRRDSTDKREDVYVHRIIALLFVPNPSNLEEVNHKDCNTQNNHYVNLEWVTRIENLHYAVKYGHMGRNSKGQFCHK